MAAGETAIPMSFALVDKMPVHATVGDAVSMPIKDLTIKPWEEIAPKTLLPALP